MSELTRLLDQEQRLQFRQFSHETAWKLGATIKQLAEARDASVAIEVYGYGQILFFHAMPNTMPNNIDWIRRKRNTVLRFGHSSYYLGEYNRSNQRELERLPHIDPKDFASQGGSFPIRIHGAGVLGAVTVSGLPQKDDHELVVQALEKVT